MELPAVSKFEDAEGSNKSVGKMLAHCAYGCHTMTQTLPINDVMDGIFFLQFLRFVHSSDDEILMNSLNVEFGFIVVDRSTTISPWFTQVTSITMMMTPRHKQSLNPRTEHPVSVCPESAVPDRFAR
jgi:hypothetical protein